MASGVDYAHSGAGTAGIVIGVVVGLSLWITVLSTLSRADRRFISDRQFHLVNVASGLILPGFGLGFAQEAVSAVV